MSEILSKSDLATIDRTVEIYRSRVAEVETVAETTYKYLFNSARLRPLVHSIKYRVKDPDHLRDKLSRKALLSRNSGKSPSITVDNLFSQIGDLAGVRVLYLRPKAITELLPQVLEVLAGYGCVVVEKPFAYTWDEETKELFRSMGVKTKYRPELYTSVHFVLKFNRQHFCRCEVQMRTLMEEVWGEISHEINYPHPTASVACQEQLKVLARIASGGTRLVDAIYASSLEHRDLHARIPPR